jgi:hypothetical protein
MESIANQPTEKIIILSLESIGIPVGRAMEMLAARKYALRNISN